LGFRIYNTLTRTKEAFVPVREGRVGMYVCGPTVYAPSHIGHAVGPVLFDCIKRYLTFRGYEVTWVLNVTDVEDKLITRAREEGTTIAALAEKYADDYFDSLRRLNVTGIDVVPWATKHIDDIVALVKRLVERDHAYVVDGDVYFDVSSFADYGKLSRRRVEELEAGARVAVNERKRDAADFALWKAAKPDEPAWDSPWGKGRPGWHIECSAMSMRYLGETFDIHGGGVDLVFPHHENEIAQSEAATGKPFARVWMHNGLTRIADQKMSKSLGNLVTIADLLSRWPGETIRFFLISTHYRQPIDFSDERIGEVARGLESFYRTFERVERILGRSAYTIEPADLGGQPTVSGDAAQALVSAGTAVRDRFLASMDDDFNTAGAVGALFELNGAVNRFIEQAGVDAQRPDEEATTALTWAAGTIRALGALLGVFEQPPERIAGTDDFTDRLLQMLVDLRAAARARKDFDQADEIRSQLADLGITLEDRPDGTVWRGRR